MTLLAWIDLVLFPLMALTILFAFTRLLIGPSLPDRVVALDLMITFSIGLICLHAISTGYRVYLDVALILALISFLASMGFSYYIIRSRQRR